MANGLVERVVARLKERAKIERTVAGSTNLEFVSFEDDFEFFEELEARDVNPEFSGYYDQEGFLEEEEEVTSAFQHYEILPLREKIFHEDIFAEKPPSGHHAKRGAKKKRRRFNRATIRTLPLASAE